MGSRPSCIVIDNTSYQNIVAQGDRIPTSSYTKGGVQEWLTKEDVEFALDSLKPKLLSLVKSLNKPIVFNLTVDKLISQHCHLCLRLPPYYSHLHPIELVWAKVKGRVADENRTFKIGEVKKVNTISLAKDRPNVLGQERWQRYKRGGDVLDKR